MTTLTEASNAFQRHADTQFFLPELKNEVFRAKMQGVEIKTKPKATYFAETGDGRIGVVLSDDSMVFPTNFAMSQIAILCGAQMSLLQRLETETAVDVLNQTFPRTELKPEMLALVDNGALRALTSVIYSRVWDQDLLSEIDRWLLAPERGFVPAVPTFRYPNHEKNKPYEGKPALFRSDRDSFFFFYSQKPTGDDGLGGMRKGIFVSNSEVGAASWEWSDFYFREVCGNFLVWNATNIKKHRKVHRGDMKDFMREFQTTMAQTSLTIGSEYAVFNKAKVTPFVGDGSGTIKNRELAVERLVDQFDIGKRTAPAIVDAAFWPENPQDLSVWGIVNGITSLARYNPHASEMVNEGLLAGKVLQLAV